DEEARAAVSYNRYAPHTALLAVSVLITAIADWPQIKLPRTIWRYMYMTIAGVLALSAVAVRDDFALIDERLWSRFLRGIAAEIKELVPPGAKVAVAAISDYGDSFPVLIRYDLWQFGDPARSIDCKDRF